jgi:hypothetical protein
MVQLLITCLRPGRRPRDKVRRRRLFAFEDGPHFTYRARLRRRGVVMPPAAVRNGHAP